MSVFQVVSTVTHRSLMNKSKDDLARWIMHLLDCRDERELVRVQRVTDLLEANNFYQQQARDARTELARRSSAPLPTHRHKKRGSEYVLVGKAEGQISVGTRTQRGKNGRVVVEGDEITVYRDDTGKLWWRFPDEFEDGRFEVLAAPRGSAGK